MFEIHFHFPAHRYHATAWQSHVNEGNIEWPPSPWRLTRALMSVGYTHLGWSDQPPPEFLAWVDQIAEHPPSYRLPPSVETHTRHYMPIIEGRSEKTSLVFDSHLRFTSGDPLVMRFDFSMDTATQKLVTSLCDNLAYLGRAESWVDVELISEGQFENTGNWMNATATPAPRLDSESARLLAPISSSTYQQWRESSLPDALQRQSDQVGKKLTKSQRAKVESKYPTDLCDCLAMDTGWLLDCGWSQPPGTQWLDFQTSDQDGNAVPVASKPPRKRRSPNHNALELGHEFALLKLTSDSVSGRTLPSISRTVLVAEALHDSATKQSDKLLGRVHDQLTGAKHAKHRHLHFLPVDMDDDRKLDHVLIHCPDGIDHSLRRVLTRLRQIYSAKLPKTFVNWIGSGTLDSMAGKIKMRDGSALPILKPGRRFQTITPFVASRHLRRKYTLAANVADECKFRDLPIPRVEVISRNAGRFRLSRLKEGKQPPRTEGYHLEIEFDEDVLAPISLGYGSHFGLGSFKCIDA